VGIPWRVAFALQADGWYLRSDIIWAKPNPMPESVTDRPTKSHEYLFLLAKNEKYSYDAEAIREIAVSDHPPGNRTHKGATAYANGATRHRTTVGLVAYSQRQRAPNGRASTSMLRDAE
jgi:DNA methylase